MSELEPVAKYEPPTTITDEQHEAALAAVRADKKLGNVAALRAAGIEGHKRDLRRLSETIAEDLREARGWSITAVENVAWEVALDKDHPNWDRANARILKAYAPQFRDQSSLALTGADGGPLEVMNPDVAMAIERFTSAVTRLAERGAKEINAAATESGADLRDAPGERPQLSPGQPQ